MTRPDTHHQHRDMQAGWLRPTIFGLMDGLVSNFSFIAAFGGGHATRHVVILAGLAGLVGGAVSMATGEYISVRSQNESALAEVAVERRELRVNAAGELAELTESFIERGVEPDLARAVATQLSRDPEAALVIHAQEELGLDPRTLASPWVAAGSSLLSFGTGAVLPLLPYLLGATSVLASAIVSLAGLFAAGAVSARFTRRGWIYAGTRQLLCGAIAAGVTFGVGALFHASGG